MARKKKIVDSIEEVNEIEVTEAPTEAPTEKPTEAPVKEVKVVNHISQLSIEQKLEVRNFMVGKRGYDIQDPRTYAGVARKLGFLK